MNALIRRFLAFCLLAAPASLSADDEAVFPPRAFPSDRYDSIMNRSPFVLPTVEVVKPQVDTSWTDDFRVVSILKMGGENVVLARKLSTDERIAIKTKENPLGLRLVDLKMAPDPNEVVVSVEMHGQPGTIPYDESILAEFPRSVAPNNPALISE